MLVEEIPGPPYGNNYIGGGGGGAGAVGNDGDSGGDSPTSGNGGPGVQVNIDGNNYYWNWWRRWC